MYKVESDQINLPFYLFYRSDKSKSKVRRCSEKIVQID